MHGTILRRLDISKSLVFQNCEINMIKIVRSATGMKNVPNCEVRDPAPSLPHSCKVR